MTEKLREMLDRVHAELESTREVDGAERDKLRAVMEDIQALLDRPADSEPEEAEQSIKRRLEEAQLHFDDSHPVLATAIRQAILLLNNMGI